MPAFVPGAHVLLFGPGYVGEAVCAHLTSVADCAITRVTRTEAQAARLAASGLDAVALSDRVAVLSVLERATHVLSTAPPAPDGADPVLGLYAGALWEAPNMRWTGYLSSTSVYGDAGGGLVDEEWAPAPASPAGQARLAAEAGWRGRADVLRLAGVYGPGRSALATLRRDGAAMARAVAAGDRVVSRIFVDDAARAVAAAARRAGTPDVFNVADDLPAPRRDVFTCASRILRSAGCALGPGADRPAEESDRDRFRTSKRVDNARMKGVLGVKLQFPTYMHGLAHLAVAEGILGGGVTSK